jgi:hypothetical protein
MNTPACRIRILSTPRIALLLALLPMVLHAQPVVPLHVGFYSSDSCEDPPNAVLLHFDGQNFNGAHSASCRDAVTRTGVHTYHLQQSCPSQQQAGNVTAHPTSHSRQLSVTSAVSFTISDDDDHEGVPVHYRFCSTTLDGHPSF